MHEHAAEEAAFGVNNAPPGVTVPEAALGAVLGATLRSQKSSIRAA